MNRIDAAANADPSARPSAGENAGNGDAFMRWIYFLAGALALAFLVIGTVGFVAWTVKSGTLQLDAERHSASLREAGANTAFQSYIRCMRTVEQATSDLCEVRAVNLAISRGYPRDVASKAITGFIETQRGAGDRVSR